VARAAPTDTLIAELAAHVTANAGTIAPRLLERAVREIPTMGRDEEEVRRAGLAMTQTMLAAFAVALEHDVPDHEIETPWLTTNYVRRLAWEGISIDEVVRGFRLAHEELFAEVTAFANARASSTEELGAFFSRFGASSFRFLDGVLTRMSAAFAAERDTIVRGEFARRTGIVGDILADRTIDTDRAERELAYRLTGTHLAVLVWPLDERAATLDDGITTICSAVGATSRLLLLEGPELLAAWIALPDTTAWSASSVEPALRESGLCVAAGRALPGLAGFRESRRQAERARTVALASRPERRLVRYEDVGLASLLLADADAARAFACEELGALAGAGDTAATLRHTLSVRLRCGGPLEAAKELYVHRNTVVQRLHRAQELIGHPLNERREQIDAALQICAVLGPVTSLP
jgi:DNA-binding PucR family transcriptional regulator